MQHELVAIRPVLGFHPRELEEVVPPQQVDEGAFRVFPIPPNIRSEDWLNRVCPNLVDAARSWPAVFCVFPAEIIKKLKEAEDLMVLADQASIVAGFVSARRPRRLQRTGLTARYIEGTIVHRTRGEKGKFGRLMESIGNQVDIEVLHTQNPKMAEALRKRSKALFPNQDNSLALKAELSDDLCEFLEHIGRTEPFDPITGITPGMYSHRLYGDWPLPGSGEASSFSNLDENSAVLVVGFREACTANKWCRNVA